MIPIEIAGLIRSDQPDLRKQGWDALWAERSCLELDHRAFESLDELAGDESVAEISVLAFHVIERLWHRRARSFQDWIWETFEPRHAGQSKGDRESAVAAVCDENYVRDAYPLITLAKHLPRGRDVQFHLIPSDNPDWHRPMIDTLRAICLVGRPSTLSGIGLSRYLPNDLRFAFPAGDEAWRGRPVSPESIRDYHRVEQWWQRERTGVYEVSECDDPKSGCRFRTDYAVIQRFMTPFGHKNGIATVVIAGATSLGTAGAVDWICRNRFDKKELAEFEEQGGAVTEGSRVEVLLEVTGRVETPRRPWKPEARLIKLFVNQSKNLARPPLVDAPHVRRWIPEITLCGGLGGADQVRFAMLDGDGLEVEANDFPAFIALCLKAHQSNGLVRADELLRDLSVWPGGRCTRNGRTQEQLIMYYLDAFQKSSMKGHLHRHEKTGLKLDAAVRLT